MIVFCLSVMFVSPMEGEIPEYHRISYNTVMEAMGDKNIAEIIKNTLKSASVIENNRLWHDFCIYNLD